ncbi:ROK family transcriptional regulator [Geothrix sp. PMB-07]|uniref:ROK family transcriptional regulator n=1 Tax=Geothrix sp. PMB-07 TaxID=3068640 RepID=UPI002740EC39|nr:ROK family transcriptional regulator [Geothrix sp. PMB-07]WLT31016.1 ROK family transcriptional regulator [Geothrix sp. PMB-07]
MKKATHQATKEHNTTLVLKTIYHDDQISRADIARTTSLTRTTVSEIVTELIGTGLVKETGIAPSTIGKPAIYVDFDAHARQLICVDLSGDEFQGALVNLKGDVLLRHALPVEGRKGEAALQLAHRLVEGLWAEATVPVLGIGIGTPGPVDTEKGIIRQAVNLGWTNLDLRESLGGRYNVPIHIANDSHVAALAECAYGGHGRTPSLVLIKVGEGIGSGIVLNGNLHTGDGFSAGEVGHLCVVCEGRPCRCGNLGCLETVASTPSVLQLLKEQAQRDPAAPLGRAQASRGLSLDLLREGSDGGDSQARGLVRDLGTHLGVVAASLAGVLNVHKIILSGMPSLFGEPLLEAMRAEIRARILPEQAMETQVCFSSIGSDIVIQGACALVLRKELNLP